MYCDVNKTGINQQGTIFCFSIDNGCFGALIVEVQKGPVQCVVMFGIDGIAHFRARKDDGNDAVAALDADRRRRLPLGNRRDLAAFRGRTSTKTG